MELELRKTGGIFDLKKQMKWGGGIISFVITGGLEKGRPFLTINKGR